jgi:hypothetical protein
MILPIEAALSVYERTSDQNADCMADVRGDDACGLQQAQMAAA